MRTRCGDGQRMINGRAYARSVHKGREAPYERVERRTKRRRKELDLRYQKQIRILNENYFEK